MTENKFHSLSVYLVKNKYGIQICVMPIIIIYRFSNEIKVSARAQRGKSSRAAQREKYIRPRMKTSTKLIDRSQSKMQERLKFISNLRRAEKSYMGFPHGFFYGTLYIRAVEYLSLGT